MRNPRSPKLSFRAVAVSVYGLLFWGLVSLFGGGGLRGFEVCEVFVGCLGSCIVYLKPQKLVTEWPDACEKAMTLHLRAFWCRSLRLRGFGEEGPMCQGVSDSVLISPKGPKYLSSRI